jgi:hypothetical protein
MAMTMSMDDSSSFISGLTLVDSSVANDFVLDMSEMWEEEIVMEQSQNENENENEDEEIVVAYDKYRLPSRQVETGKKIYNYFIDVFRWILLFAQMQSGKTETYLFAAAELLREGRVQYVVIFSGNRETELRDQLPNNFEAFCKKYRNYLQECLGLSIDEREQIMDKIEHNFKKQNNDSTVRIVWGTELCKYNGPKTDALFIWDESHYGQSLKQEADKFLREIGISADGDVDILRESRNYFLSVSATPFSEISDFLHGNQSKKLVVMKPVSAYNSVEKMWTEGRIHSYKDLAQGLRGALDKVASGSRKYAVVRSSLTNQELIESILRRAGWKISHYDSKQVCKIDGVEQDNLDFMANAPSQNTCIILKGMCRMGKQLVKENLSFVFETTSGSKTDTFLQGLLGRSCGYGNSRNVQVYLPALFCESGEIQKYISLVKEEELKVMPKKAMNLKKNRNTLDAIIPVCVKMPRQDLDGMGREEIAASVKAAFYEEGADEVVNSVENNNSRNNQIMIRERILGLDIEHFKLHNLNSGNVTYENEEVLRKILDSNQTKRPVMLGSGCGVKANGEEVKMWVCKERSCVYVDCRIDGYCSCDSDLSGCRCKLLNPRNIPKTTGKEVFRYKLEPECGVEITRQNAEVKVKKTVDVKVKKTVDVKVKKTVEVKVKKTVDVKVNEDHDDISCHIKMINKTTDCVNEKKKTKATTSSNEDVKVANTSADDCNGMFEIYIDAKTIHSVPDMLTAIDGLVQISKIVDHNPLLSRSKIVHHNVKVSEEVYQALLDGGIIHQSIFASHSLRLKVKVDPKKSSIGVIHLKAIYW